ncbi:MAG TPA: methionine--tRNA ligase [Candidatus Paceibacterota bacterium]|nr:methionine--tRNA ligase [Candidatus Paceibacterota bacterium]HPR91159.1 methionine--tRNA ligase [Candidatus Paceibacterota bacterium]
MSRYYVTTAIPYVNAKPHLGHVLEFIETDVLVRWLKQNGGEVRFQTGSDENSLKNVLSAQKANIPVKDFVDSNTKSFQDIYPLYEIAYDDYIRTTEERHKTGVLKLWQALNPEDIYKKSYKGLYCIGCEAFLKESDLVDGCCPEHKTKPEAIEEENYFFRLSKYQDQLIELISADKLKIIPESRKNEVLSLLKSGLEDISISRSRERAGGWGIAVPDDSSQVIYVWIDALANYITALNYGGDQADFIKWWQESDEIWHIIGKGISRFHAVYWPAILLSAKIKMPDHIFVHGYLTTEGEKISKSLGNVIDPLEAAQNYGVEPLRYFLTHEISAYDDGDFSAKRFWERYNSDLAGGIGNLLSRVTTLGQLLEKEIKLKKVETETQTLVEENIRKTAESMSAAHFNEALDRIWELVRFSDKYIADNKIWETIKTDQEKAERELANLVYILANIGWQLKPFMPQTGGKIITSLGLEDMPIHFLEGLSNRAVCLKKSEILFPRHGQE